MGDPALDAVGHLCFSASGLHRTPQSRCPLAQARCPDLWILLDRNGMSQPGGTDRPPIPHAACSSSRLKGGFLVNAFGSWEAEKIFCLFEGAVCPESEVVST